jgi:hypothetical protein
VNWSRVLMKVKRENVDFEFEREVKGMMERWMVGEGLGAAVGQWAYTL